jgi:hypothetical protein
VRRPWRWSAVPVVVDQVTGSSAETPPMLTYTGRALTPVEEHQVRPYIEFIRRSD